MLVIVLRVNAVTAIQRRATQQVDWQIRARQYRRINRVAEVPWTNAHRQVLQVGDGLDREPLPVEPRVTRYQHAHVMARCMQVFG